jgi:serine/threonine protein kinase
MVSEKENGQAVIQILDFGLAKARQPKVSDSRSPTNFSTKPGVVMGTFGYMSPEQLIGAAVDERTDIFSIGVILVEALTGELPFKGSTHHGLLTNMLHGSFHLAGDSPELRDLDSALQQCLAKDPALRFSSVDETQRKLIPALRKCSRVDCSENNGREANTIILDYE